MSCVAVDGAALITANVGVVFKLVVDGASGGVLVNNVDVSMVPGVKVVVIDVIDGCVLVVVNVFDVKPEVFVVVDVNNVFVLGVVLLTNMSNSVVDDNVHGMALIIVAASAAVDVFNNVFFIVVASVEDKVAVDDGDARFVFDISVVICIEVSGVIRVDVTAVWLMTSV